MEPYQMMEDLQERIERETQRILKGCPVCPECGNTVDTIGLYAGNDEYIKTDWDIYHVECFKRMLKKDKEYQRQLVDEFCEEVKKRDSDLWNFAEEYVDDYMTKYTKG